MILSGINKESKTPFYQQLKEILLTEIQQMNANEMIEPESALTSRFNISRTTVRQAISELIRENYLYTIRGKGTFVADRHNGMHYLNQIESYDEQVRQCGMLPSTQILQQEICLADRETACQMRIPENSGVLYLKRLRFADQIPLCIAESYLPLPDCAPILKKNLADQSLYTALDQDCHRKVVHVHRRIKAGLADTADSVLLQTEPGTPLLYFTNVATTQEGLVIEYCKSCFRVDLIDFTVELNL